MFAQAFDMLDVVLAVFGAVVVSLWFGHGKKLGGLLMGAVVGGVAKPAILLVLGLGLLAASPQPVDPTLKQTPEQQDKTLEFWTR